MPPLPWPARAVLAGSWALALVLVRLVVGGFGWATAAVLCSVVAAGALLLAARREPRPPVRSALRTVVVLGAWVAVQNLGLCLALGQLGLGPTAVVVGSMPLFATLVGQVWGVDRITAAGVLGLAVGFIGLLVVVLFPAQGHSWAFIAGTLAGLLAAFSAAVAARYADLRLPGRTDAVAGAHAVAGLTAVPLALLWPAAGDGSPLGYPALVGLGVLLAAFGPALLVRATGEGSLEASRVRAVGLVVAAVAGALLLGEGLSAGQAVGTVLLLAGSTLVLDLFPVPAPAGRSR